jgi:ribosomal protein S18 acetylase RimI-like enzyme
MSKRDTSVTTATDLRLVYGPNAAKKIARRFSVANVTAKIWLTGRLPQARRQEIARELIAECDRMEQRAVEIRRRWEAEAATNEATSTVAGDAADRSGPPSRGVRREA